MRGQLDGTFDIYLQFCNELTICCVCKLFIDAESPKYALRPLCICHLVFTDESYNKTFPDETIYVQLALPGVLCSNGNARFRLPSPWGRTPGQPGEYVGQNKGMDWFLCSKGVEIPQYSFKFKGKG